MDLARTGTTTPPLVVDADDEFVARRARDDRTAFAELYVRHRASVYGYLRARTASDDDALELTAVTFERALIAIDRYTSRGAGFRAWLFRIARNAAADEGRRRRRSSARLGSAGDPADLVDLGATPEDVVVRDDDIRQLRGALALLADTERDALGLRFGAGLTAREIGRVIDKREAAVQKLIERAITRLREVMA